MNLDRIREKLNGGFRPFRLCLSDGTKISVPHPEFIAVGKNVVVVVGQNDRTYTLDALHIVAIEEAHSRAKAR
jgi:hypothetical protein